VQLYKPTRCATLGMTLLDLTPKPSVISACLVRKHLTRPNHCTTFVCADPALQCRTGPAARLGGVELKVPLQDLDFVSFQRLRSCELPEAPLQVLIEVRILRRR